MHSSQWILVEAGEGEDPREAAEARLEGLSEHSPDCWWWDSWRADDPELRVIPATSPEFWRVVSQAYQDMRRRLGARIAEVRERLGPEPWSRLAIAADWYGQGHDLLIGGVYLRRIVELVLGDWGPDATIFDPETCSTYLEPHRKAQVERAPAEFHLVEVDFHG